MNKRQHKLDTPSRPIAGRDSPTDASDLQLLRKRITETVTCAAVEMVENAIAAAHDGNYVAMKYLFEMIGLYPAVSVDELEGDDTLAAVLIERLGLTGNGAKSGNAVE